MELSLKEIFGLLQKRSCYIGICILLCLSAFYIKYKYFTEKTYTASVQMYVSSKVSGSEADLNQLNYAQKVVNTYISFLETKTFYQQVIEKSGIKYGVGQLKAMTTIQAVNNTEIFQISVTTSDPNISYQLVKTMQDIAPALIKSIKGTTEISVVDSAAKPFGPSGPNIRRYTLVGGVLGFFFAVIIVLLWELLDVKVKSQEELKKKYNIPILGNIPNYNNYKRKSYRILSMLPLLKKKSKIYKTNVNNESKFMINEAYNSFRTNLRFSVRKEGCKKLVISSPMPDDGKSTTSTNLAVTIAQTGAKVLLMDCDLRKGILHNFFKLNSAPGISDALSGMSNEKDVIQYTSYENLDVITLGEIPPNPTELLGSIQMEELIKKLEKIYDYIIIDSPPVNVVSDSLSLIKLTDGVIVVVREGATTHPNIAAAINKFNFAGANILGFVINGVTESHCGHSKSHYYYYKRLKSL